MAYVKVLVKKKTGPKPKPKPIDPLTLMSAEEKALALKNACKMLIQQFKENDSTCKQVHNTVAKIKNYNLEELKNAGMNPDYFRMVSNKSDGLTFERFIERIPQEERGVYLENEEMIVNYIKSIKDGGTNMVNKANTVRDLIKEVKHCDIEGNGKLAKIVIDYYRKMNNAKNELKEALKEVQKTDINKVLDDYSFIMDLYNED